MDGEGAPKISNEPFDVALRQALANPTLAARLGEGIMESLASRASRRRSEADRFRQELLDWHAQSARRYPWREDGLDPWVVLMAEMCLHRTRADQVVPVFRSLRRLAPTPQAMVDNREEALAAMRSLGLRWRAEGIIATAEALVSQHGGAVPEDELQLRSLPGVGDYVAQAVRCFGFGRRAVLVDTNTQRITSRLNARDSTRRWQIRLDLYRLAGAQGPDAEFNYALLDLGALVCRAGQPRCEECPVRRHCAHAGGAPVPAQLSLTDA